MIGVAQQQAFQPARVGLIIAGYEVPHAHIHVIPTTSMDELSFANAAASVDPPTSTPPPRRSAPLRRGRPEVVTTPVR